MFIRPILPSLLWGAFITILCGIPGDTIPEFSLWKLLSADTWAHVFLFTVWVFLLARGFIRQEQYHFLRQYAMILSPVSGILYGAILEWMQQAVFVHRTADIMDIMANTAGSLLGILLFRWKTRGARVRYQ